MADFCNQCCKEMGFDPGELAGLVSKEDYVEKHLVAQAICEGCGYTLVDDMGNCVYPHCAEKHGDTKKVFTVKVV